MKILISRTDSIGDVILTLPLCGWIKKNIPDAEVHFLCQKLTVNIIEQSSHVDQIHIWDGTLPDVDTIIHVFPKREVAKAAKKKRIKTRIGTSHRLFHLTTCNKLPGFSRIKSDLHESQLNFKLLSGLGLKTTPELDQMHELIGWEKQPIQLEYQVKDKFNLVFHIKSRGSAKEWKSKNYLELAKKISSEKVNIILTGTEAEGELIRAEIPEIFELKNITDTTGKLSLKELIALIGNSDGLLACSTGPLHIAGISDINCMGLYPKKRPMHAGRWSPLGSKSKYLEESLESESKYLEIGVNQVFEQLTSWWG